MVIEQFLIVTGHVVRGRAVNDDERGVVCAVKDISQFGEGGIVLSLVAEEPFPEGEVNAGKVGMGEESF
jgi:hypothetical protein